MRADEGQSSVGQGGMGSVRGAPKKKTAEIVERVDLLRYFPHLYPLRTRGRFRRHGFFQAGNWLVLYKDVEGTIYIRDLWPARIS